MMLSARLPVNVPGLLPPDDVRRDRARPGARPARRAVRLSAGRRAERRRPAPSSRCRSAARQLIGVVWDEAAPGGRCRASAEAAGRRSTRRRCRRRLRTLIRHVARETLAPRGAVLKLALSVPAALEPLADQARLSPAPRRRRRPSSAGSAPRSWRRCRRRAALPAPSLAKAAGVGAGVVQAMARCGLLRPCPLPERPSWPRPIPTGAGVELTPARQRRPRTLCAAGRGRRPWRGAARRRARRRQDRGLFRGGGRGPARRPARCSCCCPRSRSRPSGWPASSAASAPHRPSGTRR